VQHIKEGIEGRPVEWYSEVFDVVFPTMDKNKANTCVACEWKKAHPEAAKAVQTDD